MTNKLIAELHQWSAETGQPLPMDATDIALYEQDGYVVDLETGALRPATYEATVLTVESGYIDELYAEWDNVLFVRDTDHRDQRREPDGDCLFA